MTNVRKRVQKATNAGWIPPKEVAALKAQIVELETEVVELEKQVDRLKQTSVHYAQQRDELQEKVGKTLQLLLR